MKKAKPALTEDYLRKITEYYENQPPDEALADVERLFSKDATPEAKRSKPTISPASVKPVVPVAAKSHAVSEQRASYGKARKPK